jgi:hypothetical protein
MINHGIVPEGDSRSVPNVEPDLHRPRPFCDWHEDQGDVLWWRIPISEAPYCGSPICLGRTASISLQVGLDLIEDVVIGMVGGWPFSEQDERHLWWTPLPDAQRIEDQVPL